MAHSKVHSSDATRAAMNEPESTQNSASIERDRQLILDAESKGTGAKLWAFTKLSGPGWLQSAITLGGGSLAGGLYLGVLAGYSMLWLQPLAMILGVVMLSAIGYVALSTGERPFRAINRHVNPVLGWGWAIATLMANLVWCMPQFALGTAALQQNLAPTSLGDQAVMTAMDDAGSLTAKEQAELKDELETRNKLVCVAILFAVAGVVVWFYNSGGWGIKVFEAVLKLMVAVVVVSFFGVVFKLATSAEGLNWGEIFGGLIPDPSLLSKPAAAFADVIQQSGAYADYWSQRIVSDQQKVMITATATAVGINMTFLLPYSMLARGWDKDFRGLAIFDLSTGLFIPFLLATSCVVIASASQFHGKPAAGLIETVDSDGNAITPPAGILSGFNKNLDARLKKELGDEFDALAADKQKLQAARDALPSADRQLAAMLVRRDAFNLAAALKNLTGETVAQYVFGVGVLGMAISTIIILMLINGFVVCEMLGVPDKGGIHRAGCFLAAFTGAMGPFLWKGDAKTWLAVPTSLFGMVLLPIAYLTFFLMMNSKSLLGDKRPTGFARFRWNVLLIIALSMATFGAFWAVYTDKYSTYGFIALGTFLGVALVVHFARSKDPAG